MLIPIRCQHCGSITRVEDMGDNAVCEHCGKFIVSISETIKKQIFGGDYGVNSMD
jgi:DNA-directed RNA polymerase subunit N (RpoN/RPB10)